MKKTLFGLFFAIVATAGIFLPQDQAHACSASDGRLTLPSSLGTLEPGKKVSVQVRFQWLFGSSPADCSDVDLTARFYVNVYGGGTVSPAYVTSVSIGKVSTAGSGVGKTFAVEFDADKLISIADFVNPLETTVGHARLIVGVVSGTFNTEYATPVGVGFDYPTGRHVWACVNKDQRYTCYKSTGDQNPTGTKDLCERFTNGCRADQSPLVSCAIINKEKCDQVAPLNTNPPPPGPTTTAGTTSQDISVNLDIRNPLAISDVNELISKVQEWLIKFSIPVGVILIIYAGILMIFSRGNSAQITKARQIIQGVALGLAIIFIGSGFVSLVESILELGGPASTPGPTATLDPNDDTCLCEPGAGVCLSQQCKSGTYCFTTNGVGKCQVPSQDPYQGDDCSVNACPGGYTCNEFKFCRRILP